MGDGIFAEVQVGGPASCRLPTTSAEVTIDSITRSALPAEDGTITEEFTVKRATDARADGAPGPAAVGIDDVEGTRRMFASRSGAVYRFEREQRGCVCDRIETFGCPVRNVNVRENRVVVSFFATGIEDLRTVVTDLRDRFETVSVQRLLRSDPDEPSTDLVFVDRGALTDRQREVLRTAHDMGYFAHPREENAETVAAALDITASTFAEHLAAAQSKLMRSIVGDGS